MVRPLTIDIPPADIADLHLRLANTRWPEGVTGSGGVAKAEMTRLVAYWRDRFDWTRQQAWLNTFEHVIVELDGVHVHAVHLRSRAETHRKSAVMLLHGWPGSFVELLGVATRLSAHCDVIVPSIPGFGFSSRPALPGMSNSRIADLMVRLAATLGYETFAVHGGDIGAGIGSWMALKHRERLTLLHLNFIPGSFRPEPAGEATDQEAAFFRRRAEWLERFGAYSHMQRTTPLTPAYALSDSPAGLAAWIVEKFLLWADPASRIDDDVLLTNVSLYWFTNTIASSMRYYLESTATPLVITSDRRISVPTDIAEFPHEMPFPPRSWVECGYDVHRWTTMPTGGHFAALEAPGLLAEDILRGLNTLV